MMPNGMGGNNMNMPNASMQRAQNGNAQQQLHAVIMEHLRASLQQLPPGWQQTFDIRERASRIMQMVTMLRNLDNSMQKCLNIAENWEFKTITQCQSKEHYFAQWDQKFAEITRKRQMQASQNGLGMPQQNNMGNMHNMGMQQNGGINSMGGMNMNNFNGMGMNMPNAGMGMPNQMNMGQQGGFPQHLQRQMQPSPMPPQNQQQPQNGSIDPSALTRNPQMQNHMPNQMSQPNQQQQQRQQQNMNPGQGGPPNGPSDNEVKQLARRMHDSTSEEQKNQIRAQFLSNMTEQQRQQARQQNMDPLARFFMQRARANLLKARQQGGQNGIMAMGANMQQNPSQSGQQPNFDFSSMMGQQANAIKSQESGGEVVPASNNNSNNNNNNVMQQGGNNQQQMMNFGQNGGGNPQMANNMQFAAMQEKQKREQMARQNHMAKQQALAQQNQLRGQPGGLNAPNALNGGQVNSPAMNMNMLNRPTFPPGQTTPSTPHQNQNQNQNMHSQPPQTPSTGANQLQQHHQNMLNQNQMGQENLHQQFLSGLNPESRAKLATLNPEQVNVLMQKFAAQRQSAMAPPGGQPNGQNMGMNMGGQPMHNQAMMGNAVPGFNSQPPPNQQGHMEPQAGLQQKLQQQQNAQLKQKAMDSRPFPKQVLQTLSLSVPEHVNSWGKLRQHIVQNQSVLPQELMGKLSAMQNQWFDTHPEELKQAVEQIKRMIHAQNVQRQGQQGPQGMPMPNGQAPQAQMVAPPAQMQQQQRPPSQAPDNIPLEHINKIREKWPQARNMTDDQIREQMRKTRANQMQQQANADMQQQQNLKNAQMNANMQRAQQMMGNGAQGQQNQQSAPQRQSGQQPQGQGQKRGNSDDVVEIPNPNAQAAQQQQQQPSQMQQSQQQNQHNMPPMPNVGGLKTREEIMAMPAEQREAYKRKMQEIQALRKAQIGIGANQPNAPRQVPQQGQQQPSTPQVQQQQQPQQNGAQNQPPANVQQELYKIRGIYAKVQSEFTKGPEVQLDPPHRQKAQELLRKLWPIAQTLDKTLLAGHRAFGEDRIKEAIKIKHIILQNAADANGTIKDYLGVSVETLMHFERFIGEYLKELKARQQAQNQPQAQGGQADAGKQAQANTQPAAQQPKPAQQPQGKQTPTTQQQKGQAQPPLNRKNSSQHARKASQNKAPPAPTDDTKKFDWSGTPTPHGVPKYDPGRTELTADKLKFPPPKKRKTTDSQSSTPAAQTGTPASPQVTSGPKRESPEQVRKMPAPMPEPEKPRFSCEEPFCFASAATQGFESEEALRKHMDEEHKTIEDPFKFLVETVDQRLTAMGVDQDGIKLPQQKSKAQTAARRPPAAQKVADRKAAGAATANATPALKAESATPATPASAGKGRAGVAATPVGKKAGEAEAKEQAREGDKTLYDSLVEQLGIEPPANQPAIAAPSTAGAASRAVEEDPFLFSLSEALGPNPTARNQLSAMDLDEPFDFDAWCSNDFRDLDLGVPREPLALTASDSDASPQLTPSSSIASQSTGEINISEAQRLKMVFEWDPSGNGDTAVPEKLRQMALSDGSVEGGAGEGDKWDWSGDGASWDEIFGMDVDGDHGFAAAFGGAT